MPLIRLWKRQSLARQLIIGVVVLILMLGGSVIGLIALSSADSAASTAHDAANDARGVADCVNNALGSRNGPSTSDARAHIAYARADKAYDSALVTVLVTPKGPGQLKPFKAFVLAAQKKAAADQRYVRRLQASQHYRALHPLGRC